MCSVVFSPLLTEGTTLCMQDRKISLKHGEDKTGHLALTSTSGTAQQKEAAKRES